MSSSWACEEELKRLAEELHLRAKELERAAEVLETLRNSDELENAIKKAKAWAKDWMK